MMNKLFMLFTALTLCAGAGILGRWIGDRSEPSITERFEILTPEVKPGEELRIKFYVRRERTGCTITVYRLILDSQQARYVLTERFFPYAPGPVGEDTYITPVVIPDGIALGPALYRTMTTFACNPIQYVWPIDQHPLDIHFNVVGK